MKRSFFVCAVVCVVFLVCLCARSSEAEGLDTLIEVGKSQGVIQKEITQEGKCYAGVKKAVNAGTLAKGEAEVSVRQKYGDPVIESVDAASSRKKWVYKPPTSTFFKGEKITLYFDGAGKVDEIKAAE